MPEAAEDRNVIHSFRSSCWAGEIVLVWRRHGESFRDRRQLRKCLAKGSI